MIESKFILSPIFKIQISVSFKKKSTLCGKVVQYFESVKDL